jgi:outer membrane usher protein
MISLSQFLLGALPLALIAPLHSGPNDLPFEFCTPPCLSSPRERSMAITRQSFHPAESTLILDEEKFELDLPIVRVAKTCKIDPLITPPLLDPIRYKLNLLAHPLANPSSNYTPAPLLPGAKIAFSQPEALSYEPIDPEPIDPTKKMRRRKWIDPLIETKITSLAPLRDEFLWTVAPMKIGAHYPFPLPVAKEYVIPETIARVDLTLTGTALKGGKEGKNLQKNLFSKVFGNKGKGQNTFAKLPVILNNRSAGTIGATIGDTPETTILDPKSVIALLEQAAKPEVLNEINKTIETNSSLTLQDLYDAGLEAMLDYERMQIRVFIPPELRVTRLQRLRRQDRPVREISPPATLSGYTNFLYKQEWIHYEQTNGASNYPSQLDFESVINYKNWVIEAFGGIKSDRDYLFQRGDIRLTRPDPESLVNYVIGDLRVPVRGSQSSPSLGGFGIYKDFDLQPYLVVQPIARQKILLRTPSEVEISINGIKLKSIKLDAGEHDLIDFPGLTGANDIELKITDQYGHEEIISFPFIYEPTSLAKGLHSYGYSIGFPFYDELGERKYDTSDPTLSFFHRYGLTDLFTVGGHFQMNLRQGMGGMQGIYSTLYGVFEGELAGSVDTLGRFDGSGLIKFKSFKDLLVPFEKQKSWSAEISYEGPHFTPIGTESTYNHVAVSMRASYNQRLFWDIHGRITQGYEFTRGELPNQYSTTVSLSKKFKEGATVRLDLTQKKPKGQPDNFNMFLSVSNNFTKQNQSVAYTRDFDSQLDNLIWQYQSPLPVGGWNLNATANHDIDSYKIGGKAAYTGRRFKSQIDHDATVHTHEADGARPKTQFRFDTALAYADGSFGISRPIYNSFALIDRKSHMKDFDIGANIRDKIYTVQADKFGPGVVHTLVPYRESKVTIEANDLPPGYSVGQNVYWLKPTYKSGTVIHVGTDAIVFLSGTLLKADGSPVNLAGGSIQYIGKKGEETNIATNEPSENKPVIFFTDKTGKFAQPGFKPGRYQLTLFTKKREKVSFEIPEDASGIYDIGNIYLEPTEEHEKQVMPQEKQGEIQE